jgi:hypothetical protein
VRDVVVDERLLARLRRLAAEHDERQVTRAWVLRDEGPETESERDVGARRDA